MSRLLFSCLLAIVNTSILAAPTLSRSDARQRAAAFLSIHSQTAAARSAQPTTMPVLTDATTPSTAYYAFNIGEGEGFVIVSTDDHPEAVLGYSEGGTFDAAALPENARFWLESLQNTDKAENPSSPVRPLLTTQWGQLWPYNRFCPVGCVTGCVATATAQVMNYHQWPQAATTAIPAYSTYGELPPTIFDWAAMGTMVFDDDENYEAVARLMQYCGRAEQMRYGASSSAYEQAVPLALTRFFGYDGGARVVYRDDYTTEQWETLILGELQAGRPVIYGGQRSTGGHEFVVDGYDGQGFYHFNWGWSGEGDGWYRLPMANPTWVGTNGEAGIGLNGYSSYQSAVIGIQPNQGGTAPTAERRLTAEEMVLTSAATMERANASISFTVKVCCPFANHTADTLKSGFGLALADGNGQLIVGSESLIGASTFLPGSFTYRGIDQKITFGANKTGTFRIVPVCNVQEGKKKVLKIAAGAECRYIEAVLTEQALTLTEHPARNLAVDDIQFTLMGNTIVATATVSNHGDDYNGLLYLFVSGLRVAYTGVCIDAGQTGTAIFCYERRWTEQDYKISYTKDDRQSIAQGTATYTTLPQDGFTVWYADGRQEHVSTSDGVATIPPTAVAADFSDNIPATIIPNKNPNCLYYMTESSTATEGLNNVIYSHYAPTLTLSESHDFYCPMAFTAGKAVYTRTVAQGYDGKGGGWTTIILPFDVKTVTVEGGQPIDWFHSAQDTGKDFWLMTYTNGTDGGLTFSHAETMTANRPYLMAIPGEAYGERSLKGRRMTFAADNVIVQQTAVTADSDENYKFAGVYGADAPTPPLTYQLNMDGSSFIKMQRRTVPFRAVISKP